MKYEYPEDELETHRREYRAFVRVVEKFGEEYEAGENSECGILQVPGHLDCEAVAGTDRDYGEYFRSIGVANYIPES